MDEEEQRRRAIAALRAGRRPGGDDEVPKLHRRKVERDDEGECIERHRAEG